MVAGPARVFQEGRHVLSVAKLLVNTCTHKRSSTSISSTTGGQVQSWSTVTASVACNVQPKSQSERDLGYRETGLSEYDVYFAPSTDVRAGDMLTGVDVISSGALEVTSTPNDATGRGRYTKVSAVHRIGFKQ